MTDLLEALRYTDEVISGEKSPIESVEITYEEAGENCTLYIVTTHVASYAKMAYDCERVAVILWEDGTIVTQRDWQTPTSLTKLEDVNDTRATDWMSPQGMIIMAPEAGISMPSVLYGL